MSFSFSLKAKKTPLQKQKELEAQKKKRDEEDAAKVYKDFLKDFGSDDDDNDDAQPATAKNAFVSAGVVEPGSNKPKPPSSSKRHYLPPSAPSNDIAPSKPAPSSHASGDEGTPTPQPGSAPGAAASGKPRAIDRFLQDLKKDQAQRDQRRELGLDVAEPSGGLNNNGGAEAISTNLFVGNLAPDIDEQALLREFGRFGSIGTVKIMWPRDDEQRRRGRNTGFVAFMRREDAEKARDALDGISLRGHVLAVGWGKTVPLPAVPVWPPPPATGGAVLSSHGAINSAAAAGSAIQFAVPAAPEATRQRMHDGPPIKAMVVGRGPDIEVQIPEDPRLRFVVDAVAFYVARDGCDFEQAIMERERNNPEFTFLFDTSCATHAYYRWRLFSLASGDTLSSWRVDPFLMVQGSNRWVPPPMTLAAIAAQKSATSQQQQDAALPELARERLNEILNNLTVDRRAVCDAMVFALDHAEYAADVTDALVAALTAEDVPGPLRVARLFLLSDILHNTSAQVRSASRYRSKLQDALPDVFEGLSDAYRNAEGRMAQDKLRKHVLKVLRVWRGWYIFSDDFINGLQATLLRSGTGPGGQPISDATDVVDAAAVAALAALTDEELEVRCKHRGLSRKGGRQAQLSRLLELDAYLNSGTGAGSRPTSGAKQAGGGDGDAGTKGDQGGGEGGGWVQVGGDGSAGKKRPRSS